MRSATRSISRFGSRKIVVIGLVLQIILFSMYMTVFQSEHEVERTRQIMQVVHFTQDALAPLTVNQNKSAICNGGEKNCVTRNGERMEKITSSCEGLLFPRHLMRKDTWQTVDAGRNGYVFSAYYDRHSLKILGVSSSNLGQVSCQLWYLNGTTSVVEVVETSGSVGGLPEGHGKRYTAAFFTCKLPPERKTIPFAVSVVKEKCKTPDNVLPVTVINPDNTDNNFTVCVTPFNFRYGRAYELIEWIELNRILGADHFIFYNYSVASNVEKVLQSYINQDIVEVVDWQLPVGVATWPPTKGKEEIHYFGQIASLNECLLRTRGRSKYLVNLDLDEFIIPRKKDENTWSEMLTFQPNVGGYIFANVFFRKEWDTSRTHFTKYEIAKQYKLVTLLKLQHEKEVYKYKMRSKYIVKPYAVDVLGIHNIWKSGGKLVNVPHEVALLHHYRNWMKYDDKQARLDDSTIVEKFKDSLIDNVVKQWTNLPGVEQDIPLCDKPRDFGGC